MEIRVKYGNFDKEVDKKAAEYNLLNGVSMLKQHGYSLEEINELVKRMYEDIYKERRRLMLWKC